MTVSETVLSAQRMTSRGKHRVSQGWAPAGVPRGSLRLEGCSSVRSLSRPLLALGAGDPEVTARQGGQQEKEGLRLGSRDGTYLNLPWQCWHWSPTQPGSHRQVELTQRPEKQEPVLSQGLDWDT